MKGVRCMNKQLAGRWYQISCCMTAIVVLILHCLSAKAHADTLTPEEGLNVLVMQEVSTTTLTVFGSKEALAPGQHLVSSGSYSDSAWNYSVSGILNGKALTLAYTGHQTGLLGSGLTV